jgi:hypothetical protein
MGDESAMNFGGLNVLSSTYLLFFAAFLGVGSKVAENVARSLIRRGAALK